MNFSFETQGNNTYLVAKLPDTVEIDTMTLGMITNNSIAGVASAVFTQLDNTKYVKYNISAKVSLAQLFEGYVNKKKILGVFVGICNALQNAEDYMLDFCSFLYDVDKIYVNVSTLEVSLVCIPVVKMEQNIQDAKSLFKSIMFSAQFDSSENNDYVGKIINYLNSNTAFSVIEFKKMLDSLQQDVPVTVKTQTPQVAPKSVEESASKAEQVSVNAQPTVNVQPSTPKNPAATAPSVNNNSSSAQMAHNTQNASKSQPTVNSCMEIPGTDKKQKKAADKEKKGLSFWGKKKEKKTSTSMAIPGMAVPPQEVSVVSQAVVPQPVVASMQPQTSVRTNFGETTVLGMGAGIGETTVLGVAQAAQVQPNLIRRKTDEHISVSKPVFRIGKERSYVDYFIGDNTAISRSHANIIIRDGEYFVVDTNSTNHTYVNGVMLQSNVETAIAHGDIIRLANEDFEFRLY